jgi:hypothetical protein
VATLSYADVGLGALYRQSEGAPGALSGGCGSACGSDYAMGSVGILGRTRVVDIALQSEQYNYALGSDLFHNMDVSDVIRNVDSVSSAH